MQSRAPISPPYAPMYTCNLTVLSHVQMFAGPPENVRDHVVAASKALMRGDWRRSFAYVCALPVWALVPQKVRKSDGEGCGRMRAQKGENKAQLLDHRSPLAPCHSL